MKKYTYYLANLGLFYNAAIWGSTFYIVKDAINTVNPVTLVAYRFGFSAFIMGIILIATRRNIFTDFKEGMIMGLFLWLQYIPQTIGLHFTSAANSGFITGLFVVFVPIFSLFLFRTLPSFSRILAIVLSILGLWLLTGGPGKMNIGDMLTLITAMAYALHILFGDKFVKGEIDPYILAFQQFLFVSLASFCGSLLFHLPLSYGNENTILAMIFLGLFPTISAFVIQMVVQRVVSPVRVTLIFALEPVFAAIFAWTLGGEQFYLTHALGGLLIVVAIIISEINITTINLFKTKQPVI